MNLLKIFKTKPSAASVLKTIEAIHNEFDSAADRLLAEAKGIISMEIGDKGKRLSAVGFGKTKEATIWAEREEAKKESTRLSGIIRYFSIRYPNNKFITDKEVKRICEKYSLVLGDASDYKGGVPDKNLKEIEAFSLKESDGKQYVAMWFTRLNDTGRLVPCRGDAKKMYFGYRKFESNLFGPDQFINVAKPESGADSCIIYERPSYKICASASDFDMRGKTLKGYLVKNEVPDPIVLQPVNEGYLIVTKWGLEASDELVVNQNHN